MDKPQEVQVAVSISGYYCAFHEASLRILYDYTNDKQLDYNTKEDTDAKLEKGHDGEYSDCEMKSGILYKGKYYIEL